MRIGGVAWDLPPGWKEKALAYVDRFEPLIDEYNALISYNKIYTERLANVAVVTPADAVDYNLVGPNLRGSGIKFDIRRHEPYSVYPELDFEIPVGRGEVGTLGDCFDRYIVRMVEMKECCRIIRQCLRQMPGGPVIAKVARNYKPPAGDAYVRVESARGDMGWYVVSDGTSFPYRCKIRTGSFSAISIIQKLSRNLMIADLIAVIASLDLVAPEIDR
jgi:NADH-quinone oxidoreductase subunit D